MAKIDRVEVTVDLLKLLQGEIVLPELRIAQPDLLLETRPDGPPNWQFGEAEETSRGPPALPRIGRLEVSDASIRYHDLGSGRNVAAELPRIAGRTDPDLKLNAHGKVQGEPLDLEITGAALAQLENGAEPYPASLALKLGQSDLHGDLSLDLFQEVPAIRAKFASDRVVTTDFTALLQRQQRGDATLEKPSGEPERALEEVLSKAGGESVGGTAFDPNQLPALDAELQYSIAELQGPDLALRDLNLNAALHDRLPRLALTGGGQYKGNPVVLNLQAGAKGEPGSNAAYVIDARIEAGQTRITAAGSISKPEQLQGVEVRFELASPDVTELLRALGIETAALPPIRAAGKVIRNEQVWQLNDASVQMGESNLAGRLSVDLSRPRPFISADLESDRLRAQDLKVAPVRTAAACRRRRKSGGRKPQARKRSPKAPHLFSAAAGINFDALPKVDADVNFRGSDLEAPEVRLAQLELDLKLRDGVAVIDATGEGTFRERQPVTFEIHAGTEDSLENPESRYPLDVSSGMPATVTRPRRARSTTRSTLPGSISMSPCKAPTSRKLGELLELPLPGTPPYKLAGKITHQEQEKRWNFVALRGTVGDSDIQGDVSLELSGERPTVVADLKSKTLDLDDLGVLVGAPPGTGPGETASAEQRAAGGTGGSGKGARPARQAVRCSRAARVRCPDLLHGRYAFRR